MITFQIYLLILISRIQKDFSPNVFTISGVPEALCSPERKALLCVKSQILAITTDRFSHVHVPIAQSFTLAP